MVEGFDVRINIGQVDLSDDVAQLLKTAAQLKGISMRAYVSHALDGFIKRHEKAILKSVKHKALMYGITPQEAMERLYTEKGFDDLKVVNPTPFNFDELEGEASFFKPGVDDACLDCDVIQELEKE